MTSIFGRSQQVAVPEAEKPVRKSHVIVLGNEKGGSGKTTTGMHILVALMRLGFKVGSIDIDARQRSLSRYLDNRRKTSEREGVSLPIPHHIIVTRSPFNVLEEAEEDEFDRFNQALDRVASCDFVLIDSPGNDTYMSRLAHSYADTIITPINDSFVDLDVLATVDGATMQIVRPSIYSEMVWEQKLARAKRDGGSIEWVVMRNRLSHLDAKNKRYMKKVTEELSRRIGFRLAPGFSERVIYREMFLQGLTVLDVIDMSNNSSISLSHVAAKQEVRDLLKMLRIPEVDRRINELRHRETEGEGVPSEAIAENTDAAVTPDIAEAKEPDDKAAAANAHDTSDAEKAVVSSPESENKATSDTPHSLDSSEKSLPTMDESVKGIIQQTEMTKIESAAVPIKEMGTADTSQSEKPSSTLSGVYKALHAIH